MSGIVNLMVQLGGDTLMSVFLVVMLLGAMIAAYCAAVPGNMLAVRLAGLKDRVKGNNDPAAKKERFKLEFSMATLKRLVEKLKLTRGAEAETTAGILAKAGYRSREALIVYMGLRVLMPVIATTVVFIVVASMHLAMIQLALTGCSIAVVATYLPPTVLKRMISARNKRFTRALPDVLDLLVICAEGGLSLDGALSRVSKEFRRFLPEMGDELGLTAVELGFLPARRDALMNLGKRVDIPGVRTLVQTLIQTERYGTPLAQALRTLSVELRDERMLKAEEKAARLPATMTVPMIVFILPAVFIVLIGPAMIQVFKAFH
jgi:tight adherence protein C